MSVILQTRGLSKHFGGVAAASDINVGIDEHSVVGLIGSNGAGKTTFVNLVTGYLKPSTGSIHYAERDITRLAPRQITRLGIARSFQIPQLYDSMSVRENVLVALGIVARNGGAASSAREQETAAQALLARFGLETHAHRPARVLPQGIRKQLDIALAMAGEPRVLMLDEPTSGVAAEEKFGIMDMILEVIRTQRVTVLFVEHDMDVVSRYAQRVLAFYDGRVIADADPAQVLADAEVQKYVTGKSHTAAGAPRHA